MRGSAAFPAADRFTSGNGAHSPHVSTRPTFALEAPSEVVDADRRVAPAAPAGERSRVFDRAHAGEGRVRLPRKGLAHAPAQKGSLSNAGRVALLTAIARAQSWAELALKDPAFDFVALAKKEKLSERYIRLLMPLVFLSPTAIDAIADGEVPADLTPTTLSRNLPLIWAEQERRFQL